MATKMVKPAEGRRVLNHQRGFNELDPKGETVEVDATVRRWLRDGDVIEADAPAPAADAKKAKQPAQS